MTHPTRGPTLDLQELQCRRFIRRALIDVTDRFALSIRPDGVGR